MQRSNINSGRMLRIVVFSSDTPYPPNRGGRADVWRRIEAFRQLGHEVFLVNLTEASGPNAPTPQDLAHIDSVVEGRFSFPIKRGPLITAKQLLRSRAVPWHASTRIPSASEKDVLLGQLDRFAPGFLWLDGPWFSVLCREAAQRYSIPMLYRSHNIEHIYLAGQAKAALSMRDRIAWSLACIGLKNFETNILKDAASVFDISVDDLSFWKVHGINNIHWLPPLPELAFRERPRMLIPSDVVFIGNLGTPNNVRGVAWLVTEVVPRVRARLPDIAFRIVGSNPTPYIRQLLENTAGVELCASVPDTTPYLFGAKVLVNPVMTGSGVQVKMLDMLMTDAPIVTASQGTRGLPADFKRLFRIADDADSFARAVMEELASSSVDLAHRDNSRKVFSVTAVGHALDTASQARNTENHA